MENRLVFDHTIEGLFVRGLGRQMTPRLKERLRQAGLDLDHRLMPAYPFPTWVECIGVAARELYPDRTEAEGWRLLGERLVEGYQETVLGNAMFAVLKALGPRRMLMRAQKSFRSGNNYSEIQVRDLGPTELEMWMNDTDLMVYFVQGVFLAAMYASGAPGSDVEIVHTDEKGTTYRLSWRD
ncbi:DUF2378 family protein [Hyalangium versicolor]|uniref:DUF2378 family protein n=1 Tax=Hyalangium versicolor TaxID=2861190 RepID=UPI001CCAE6BB|nr:DUF2378 family protein [Hyalangium versicolor]